MTVKVTVHYQMDGHEEVTTFEFDDSISQSEIENEVEQDFWDWMQTYSYGWSIKKIERK